MFSSLFPLSCFIGDVHIFFLFHCHATQDYHRTLSVLSLGSVRLILLMIHPEFFSDYIQTLDIVADVLLTLGHNFKLHRVHGPDR